MARSRWALQATTAIYKRIRAAVDAVPAIDTHDHLRPFDQIAERDVTHIGRGMTLHSIWRGSYYPWINPPTAWRPGESFGSWWSRSKDDFQDSEALAEKVVRGELREEQAVRIGRQIMRENALKLFPKLQRYLWKEDG